MKLGKQPKVAFWVTAMTWTVNLVVNKDGQWTHRLTVNIATGIQIGEWMLNGFNREQSFNVNAVPVKFSNWIGTFSQIMFARARKQDGCTVMYNKTICWRIFIIVQKKQNYSQANASKQEWLLKSLCSLESNRNCSCCFPWAVLCTADHWDGHCEWARTSLKLRIDLTLTYGLGMQCRSMVRPTIRKGSILLSNTSESPLMMVWYWQSSSSSRL